jgi:hypothetical protein
MSFNTPTMILVKKTNIHQKKLSQSTDSAAKSSDFSNVFNKNTKKEQYLLKFRFKIVI